MSEPVAGAFRGRVHVYPLRVYMEDTDVGGVVYHANYLKYAERARTEMVRALGHNHRDFIAGEAGTALALAVKRCEINFLAPAQLDDELAIETTLTEVGAATVTCVQTVLRRGEPIVTICTTLACMRLDRLRPTRLPASLRHTLNEFLNAA
ncbi:MAG: YbgC/FadM family acyl-CoA thioesterase [Alphaproteobacteria bacterium]|nr:YbgC/FadM family acyl-CoA thioesterase [Alphaproteobacteria bacterium]